MKIKERRKFGSKSRKRDRQKKELGQPGDRCSHKCMKRHRKDMRLIWLADREKYKERVQRIIRDS